MKWKISPIKNCNWLLTNMWWICWVSFTVFPVFIKKPVDITVKAGQPAKLQCSATGQPQPVVISWHKDGDDFPAARERRMYVLPKDDQFFIASTRNTDEGVYTCRAENEAGVITANATVTILGECRWRVLGWKGCHFCKKICSAHWDFHEEERCCCNRWIFFKLWGGCVCVCVVCLTGVAQLCLVQQI